MVDRKIYRRIKDLDKLGWECSLCNAPAEYLDKRQKRYVCKIHVIGQAGLDLLIRRF